MQIDVQFDGGELLRRFEERGKTAQVWLDSEILRSTEPFVPMDQGDLIGSGVRGTVPGSVWFDRSKKVNLAAWIAGVERAMKGKL